MGLKKFLDSVSESNMPVSAKMVRESLRNGTYHRDYDQGVYEKISKLLKISLVKEPAGEGVSIICDDGTEYRYTADENHPKYNTAKALLAYAQGLNKHLPAGPVLGKVNQNSIQYYKGKVDVSKL